jgi:hypothetical protein
VTPDQAVVTIGAQAQHQQAAEAIAAVNRAATQIINRWQQGGIARGDIRTSGVTVFPVYSQSRDGGTPQIAGYRAIYLLTATLTNTNAVGQTIDAAIAAGANVIDGITFGLRDPSAARAEALSAAVREARQKADVIAAAAGLRVRAVDRIVEGGVVVQPREMRTAAAGAPTPIEPGNVVVTAQVTVVFNY